MATAFAHKKGNAFTDISFFAHQQIHYLDGFILCFRIGKTCLDSL